MLIGSLVELHVGLHSWLRFSPFEKPVFKSGSTPPRNLLNTLLSDELLKPFSYCYPDSSSIPSGLIEKAPASSIAFQHRWIDRAFVLRSNSLLLDTYSIPQLSTSISSTPTSIASSTPLDTLSIEIYWVFYLSLFVRSEPHFTPYLSQLISVFSPKLSHLSPILILKRFFKLFSRFSSLGKLLISHSSCISCFETLVLGVLKIFGFFKIVELFLKFWDGFSLKWV